MERPGYRRREFTPNLYPPFPSEAQPCAELQTLSLAAIQAGDQSEQARLLTVCKNQGFFYLEVSNTTSQHLPAEGEAIGHLAEDVFKLSLEEKIRRPGRKPYSLLGCVYTLHELTL